MKKITITLLFALLALISCAQEYPIYAPVRIYGYLSLNQVTILPSNPSLLTVVKYQDTIRIYGTSGWQPLWPTKTETGAGSGSVTSVNVSGGTTGLTTTGGPITSTGTITLSGTLSAANGGTGLTSYNTGDLLYASGATTLSKLSDVSTGYALVSGGIGAAPIWSKIGLTSHVNGVLPITNGGTGTPYGIFTGSPTQGQFAIMAGTSTITGTSKISIATDGAVELNDSVDLSSYTYSPGMLFTITSTKRLKPVNSVKIYPDSVIIIDSLGIDYVSASAEERPLGLSNNNKIKPINLPQGVQIEVTTETLVSGADSVYVLTIPEALAGMNLIKLEAYPGSVTGDRTMSVVAYRKRSSTVITMTSSGASFIANATINTSYDDVQRGDKIAIGWTFTGGTTDPVGLIVQLTFQKP